MGGEENAAILRQHGSPPDFPFPVRDHLFLGESLDLLDFETAAAVSGRKFVYLRRAAALLEMALCKWTPVPPLVLQILTTFVGSNLLAAC